VALGRQASDRSVVVVRGWKLAIIHREGRQDRQLLIALSGPVTAIAATTALWPLTQFSLQFANAFSIAPAIAATHLLSLLPMSADGRMVLNSLRARRIGVAT